MVTTNDKNKVIKEIPGNRSSEEKCPICESVVIRKLIDWGEYAILKCKCCKLIYASPLPDDELLSNFYQGFLFNLPVKSEVSNRIKKRKKELIDLFDIKSNIRNKNFLDFGGGTGSAFRAASELNLNVYYHDLDEKAKAFVKLEYELKEDFIINDINETKIRFDYVFSDNVIEHLKDPIKHLEEMKRVLNKNGEIVIKTPHGGNTESIFYPLITIRGYFLRALKSNTIWIATRSYFSRFWHCDPPRHLFSFSKSNLKLIAIKAGFEEREIEISYYRLPLFKYSISEIFIDFRKSNSLKSMVFRVIVLPIIPIEIVTKILQIMLLKMNVLTPGGIILKLRKAQHHEEDPDNPAGWTDGGELQSGRIH